MFRLNKMLRLRNLFGTAKLLHLAANHQTKHCGLLRIDVKNHTSCTKNHNFCTKVHAFMIKMLNFVRFYKKLK